MPQTITSVRPVPSQGSTTASSAGSKPSGVRVIAPAPDPPSAATEPSGAMPQARRFELPQSTAIQSTPFTSRTPDGMSRSRARRAPRG